MRYNNHFKIYDREIALDQPTYFIADIAASHDGDLERAKALIWQAKEAGAECAKFQHFLAKDIVSDRGFKQLGGQMAHQSKWKKSVYEIFDEFHLPRAWTPILAEECKMAGIHYMTTPYDIEAIEMNDPLCGAWKIGSGDVSWPQFISEVAKRNKPMFVATGASDMEESIRAAEAVLAENRELCLMQCNTNYTGSHDNFSNVNLNVLKAFATAFPGLPLGLSDHTPGHAAVLGAVALGARAIEKHFTDDNNRDGPDHGFSMTPTTWRDMVDRTRELEAALGDGVKRVEPNEGDSIIVQRRCLRLKQDLPKGHILTANDIEALRPAPPNAYEPHALDQLIGRSLKKDMVFGDALTPENTKAAKA